mgnify:CR=1 FL=1
MHHPAPAEGVLLMGCRFSMGQRQWPPGQVGEGDAGRHPAPVSMSARGDEFGSKPASLRIPYAGLPNADERPSLARV